MNQVEQKKRNRPTKQLQKLWWDWLSTGERALHALYEQEGALTIRDYERIIKIQPELDQLLERMQKLDQEASQVCEALAEEFKIELGLSFLMKVIPPKEASELKAVADRIHTVATNLKRQFERNRLLVHNELTYISGTLTLMAKIANGKKNPYQKTALTSIMLDHTT